MWFLAYVLGMVFTGLVGCLHFDPTNELDRIILAICMAVWPFALPIMCLMALALVLLDLSLITINRLFGGQKKDSKACGD